jgi:hypothetical protein
VRKYPLFGVSRGLKWGALWSKKGERNFTLSHAFPCPWNALNKVNFRNNFLTLSFDSIGINRCSVHTSLLISSLLLSRILVIHVRPRNYPLYPPRFNGSICSLRSSNISSRIPFSLSSAFLVSTHKNHPRDSVVGRDWYNQGPFASHATDTIVEKRGFRRRVDRAAWGGRTFDNDGGERSGKMRGRR